MSPEFKRIWISIFIGAFVAFLTSLFDAIIDLLKDNGNNIFGVVSAMVSFLARTRHNS